MSARLMLVLVACTGLAFSAWWARPVDLGHLAGWRSAVVWSSLGWIVLIAGVAPWAPLSGLIAAIVMATAVEVVVVVMQDPLLHAAKPLYQVPPLLVCAYIGCLGGRKDRS